MRVRQWQWRGPAIANMVSSLLQNISCDNRLSHQTPSSIWPFFCLLSDLLCRVFLFLLSRECVVLLRLLTSLLSFVDHVMPFCVSSPWESTSVCVVLANVNVSIPVWLSNIVILFACLWHCISCALLAILFSSGSCVLFHYSHSFSSVSCLIATQVRLCFGLSVLDFWSFASPVFLFLFSNVVLFSYNNNRVLIAHCILSAPSAAPRSNPNSPAPKQWAVKTESGKSITVKK